MKKYIKKILEVLIFLVISISVISCGKSKVEIIKEYLYENNYSEAISIYNSINKEEDKNEALNILRNEDHNLKNKFISRELDEKTVFKYLNQLKEIDEIEKEVNNTINQIDELVMSKEAYDAGIKSLENKDYKRAISQFKAVIEDDINNYGNAQDKIKEVKELAYKTILINIDECKIAYSNSYEKALYPDQLQIKLTNNFNKTIKNFNICFIAYDYNNKPIEIPTYLNSNQSLKFMATGQDVNILPGASWGDGTLGWNIESSDNISKVIAIVKEIEFNDGEIWSNPIYDLWTKEALGEEW